MMLELPREARTEPLRNIIEDQVTQLLAGFACRCLGSLRSLWHIPPSSHLCCGIAELYSQFSAQEKPCAVQSCLDGRHGKSHCSSYLLVGKTFEIAQDDNALVDRFQLVQSFAQQLMDFMLGVFLIQRIGPVDYRPNQVMSVFLELRQEFVVFDFFFVFAAPDLTESGVHCQPVKPSQELRIALERFGFAVDCPKNVLNHFFRVGDVAEDAMRDIVQLSRIKVENLFQRTLVTRLEPGDQTRIGLGCSTASRQNTSPSLRHSEPCARQPCGRHLGKTSLTSKMILS